MRKEELQEVKTSALLAGLSDQDLADLATICHDKDLAEGMTIFIENMQGESLYLIREGAVRITRLLAEGDEETLVILGPEEAFGEMAVLENAPRAATAKVVEKARLIAIRRADFDKLCHENPRLGIKVMRNILQMFSRRVRENSKEYQEILLYALGREK